MADSASATGAPALALLPRQEAWPRTFARRALTVPAFLIAALVYLSLLPVILVVAVVFDTAARRRFATTRALAMVGVYLFCEAAGILACGWIWLRHRDRESFLDANFRLQCWWAGSLYRAGKWLFSLRLDVEGVDLPVPGPVLVFSRHVSPIDNLLPVVLVSLPHRIRLRWVINRSLLRDPCLDIVGNRLPNCFVANSSNDSESEIRRVDALGRGLGADDGVLIFPEGGLFSPVRRTRVLQRLEGTADARLLEAARSLENVLPPRLGGSMALLSAAEGVDAVFLAHTGLEDSTRYQSILAGGLIGRTIKVRIWRVPASEIPASHDARIDWLFGQWRVVDGWIAANRAE